jgi:uroporphyrinogen-III decarboxylase
MTKDHFERSGIDRVQTAIAFNTHTGYFQCLMAFMGFTEGLCALFEEPETVKECLEYVCDFYIAVTENMIDYYKPDILCLKDDTASWQAPFVSLETYEDIFIPLYERHAKFARERGIPISFHNCGKCETMLDSLYGIGVRLWDPAQTCNDLQNDKKKFGNSLVIAGGWDARGRLLDDAVTDEELYEAGRQTIEALAPGGGCAFGGGILAAADDQNTIRKNAVIHNTAYEIGHSIYKT